MISKNCTRTVARACSASRGPLRRLTPVPLRKIVVLGRSQLGDKQPATDTPVQDSLRDATQSAEKVYTNVTSSVTESLNAAGDKISAVGNKAAGNISQAFNGSTEDGRRNAEDINTKMEEASSATGSAISDRVNNAAGKVDELAGDVQNAARKATESVMRDDTRDIGGDDVEKGAQQMVGSAKVEGDVAEARSKDGPHSSSGDEKIDPAVAVRIKAAEAVQDSADTLDGKKLK